MNDGLFEALVTERATTLLRTAYLLTGGGQAASDLLQTGLIAVHRRGGGITDLEEATALARREMVAAHTGWQSRIRVGDLLADSSLLAGARGLPGFARQPSARGPQDELSTALAGLPARVRAVLVLRHGAGLSETATAALLRRPAAAVAADTARGLALLDTDGTQLGQHLTQRAQSVAADPERVRAATREGATAQRDHRLALSVLALVLVAIALLVVVSL